MTTSTIEKLDRTPYHRRVRQTLTDKTSFAGSSAEQWGTEEATLDNAVLPAVDNVTVFAQLNGYVGDFTTTTNLTLAVEISLDGGSTWSTGLELSLRDTGAAVNIRQIVTVCHQVTGAVTGDIQARAMATAVGGVAESRDLRNGAIYLEVSR
jgi:hypothetical protein